MTVIILVELLEQLDKIERSRDFTNVRRLKDIGMSSSHLHVIHCHNIVCVNIRW